MSIFIKTLFRNRFNTEFDYTLYETRKNDDVFEMIKELQVLVSGMYKKLKHNICKLEIQLRVFIIPNDTPEITKYLNSEYIDQNTRVDYYDTFVHREYAIREYQAYKFVDWTVETIVLHPYQEMPDYLGELVHWNDEINYKENYVYRTYHFYTYDSNDVWWNYNEIPIEHYYYQTEKKLVVNDINDIMKAYHLYYTIRMIMQGSKQFKKLINRCERKLRFIECDSMDEREVFSTEIYEREFVRSEWL